MNTPNLENDLLNSAAIKDKCKQAPKYSQHFYAALCDNIFEKEEHQCQYSWKEAARIVSQLNDGGDYDSYEYSLVKFVPEGYVTEEVELAFNRIGWTLKKR